MDLAEGWALGGVRLSLIVAFGEVYFVGFACWKRFRQAWARGLAKQNAGVPPLRYAPVGMTRFLCGESRDWNRYSVRRASIGSIFAARRQGTKVAATAAMAKMQRMGRIRDKSVGEVP
jgi:hypothetical protein